MQAAVGSDDEDMTDAQMFRLDAALSAAIKSATEGKSQASRKAMREALVDFKFRVMSLLELYIKLCPHSALLPTAVPSLLKSLRQMELPGGPQQLAAHLHKVIELKLSRSSPLITLASVQASMQAGSLCF